MTVSQLTLLVCLHLLQVLLGIYLLMDLGVATDFAEMQYKTEVNGITSDLPLFYQHKII